MFCVHKATRAGATISLVKNSIEMGKKVAIIEPTIRLIDSIENQILSISTSKPKIGKILSNFKMCRKLPETSDMKFLFRPNCRKCEFNSPNDCSFQKVLSEKHDLILLSNQKLRALQLSQSTESELLLKKIFSCDVLVLDEFTRTVLKNLPRLTFNISKREERIKDLKKKLRKLPNPRSKLHEIVTDLFLETIELFLNQFNETQEAGTYSNVTTLCLSEDELRFSFIKLWDYTAYLSEKGIDTQFLQDVLILSVVKELVLTIDSEEYTVTAKVEDALDYLRSLIENMQPESTVFFVDSYQPLLNHLKVFDRPIHHVPWGKNGDPLATNDQQIIFSDRTHWGVWNFYRDEPLKERIKNYLHTLALNLPEESLLIVTPNKIMKGIISDWNLPKNISLTYFRSDKMRGLTIKDKRVMICVGGPYLPLKSYLPESKSFNFEYFSEFVNSLSDEEKSLRTAQILKIDDIRSEFVNSIGRIKDPEGKRRSLVITLGMKQEDVNFMLEQQTRYNISLPHLLQPILRGGLMRDSQFLIELWFNEDLKELTRKNIFDLPLLARILRLTQEKTKLRASEILQGKTRYVKKVAKANYCILQHYRIRSQRIQGGSTFEKC